MRTAIQAGLVFALALAVFVAADGGADAQPKGSAKLPDWCQQTPTGVTLLDTKNQKVAVVTKPTGVTVLTATREDTKEVDGWTYKKVTITLSVPSAEAKLGLTTHNSVTLAYADISVDGGKAWRALKHPPAPGNATYSFGPFEPKEAGPELKIGAGGAQVKFTFDFVRRGEPAFADDKSDTSKKVALKATQKVVGKEVAVTLTGVGEWGFTHSASPVVVAFHAAWKQGDKRLVAFKMWREGSIWMTKAEPGMTLTKVSFAPDGPSWPAAEAWVEGEAIDDDLKPGRMFYRPTITKKDYPAGKTSISHYVLFTLETKADTKKDEPAKK